MYTYESIYTSITNFFGGSASGLTPNRLAKLCCRRSSCIRFLLALVRTCDVNVCSSQDKECVNLKVIRENVATRVKATAPVHYMYLQGRTFRADISNPRMNSLVSSCAVMCFVPSAAAIFFRAPMTEAPPPTC